MSYQGNNQNGQTFAKAIFLGDPSSGRSSLIRNFCMDSVQPADHAEAEKDFFIPIELEPFELEGQEAVILKMWAYADNLSKKDEQLAFRGALFAIVTFNICNQASFKSVFDKWIPLKEALCPDSFLVIVGSHMDEAHARALSVQDISKACAKKDALYIELSNTTGQNIPLLRRLLCRRVQAMLLRREELIAQGTSFTGTHSADDAASEETKQPRAEHTKPSAAPAVQADLSIPYLEPMILCDSVGAALASVFGLDAWKSFEQHETELKETGRRIEGVLQDLATAADGVTSSSEMAALIAGANEDLLRQDALMGQLGDFKLDFEEEDEEDLYDLKAHYKEIGEAFQLMGLAVPQAILAGLPPPEPANLPTSLPDDYLTSSPSRPNLRKLLVRLPSNAIADMVLDLDGNLDQQIELFLLSHSLSNDDEARKKLAQTTMKVQRDYMETSSRPRSVSSRSSVANHSVGNASSQMSYQR